MAKTGFRAWATAHAKWSVWVKKNLPKRCEKRSYDNIRVVVSKKALQKRPNTGIIRGFKKWPKLASMHWV